MKHEEDDEQRALIEWAELASIGGIRVSEYLFAIPNGGKRNPKEAARMKGLGVKAGVSDLFLPVARGGYHGLWIEMKAKKGKTSEAQADWINRMREQGYMAGVCHGWIPAKNTIKDYLEYKLLRLIP